MTFTSLTFLIFFITTLVLYYRLRHGGQNVLLLIGSYVFYGWWDYRFLALIAFSTTVDYFCGLWIERAGTAGRRRLSLTLSIVVNLGCLAFFKYFNFFVESASYLLSVLGMEASVPTLRIILPVGISFYTFQSMSYTIDIYCRKLNATTNYFDFALYVSFFPQLVAGPIERARTLLPQVQSVRRYDAASAASGVWLVLVGYVKKVVIADRLGQIADLGFATDAPGFDGLEGVVFVYAFAFQIYGDFSGYSDIARGVSKILGFDLMINFRRPYLVGDPSAFWRNWHISLSTWLRDYLYIPLGGNRGGTVKTQRNLMTTMVLGGLWHGAGWAYVLWGVYHGLLLALHRAWTVLWQRWAPGDRPARSPSTLWRVLTVVVFFQLTCVGWLFFRVGSVDASLSQFDLIWNYLALLAQPGSLSDVVPWTAALGLFGGLALILQWKSDEIERFDTWPVWAQSASACTALVLIAVCGVFDGAQFIYFQF